jgi:hypothetical protein
MQRTEATSRCTKPDFAALMARLATENATWG